jgi:phospholipid-translocating ATPase
MDHHVIQEIHYMQKHITDPKMYKREKRKAVQKTKIGFSARVDANLSMQRAKNRYYDPTYTADVKSPRDPPASNVDLFESPLFSSFKRTV